MKTGLLLRILMFRPCLGILMNIVYVQTEKGGGVSIYVKSNLPYKVRRSLAFTGNSYESIVIEFDKHVFNSKRNVIIGIFYRSPNSSLKLFNEKMEKILNIIEMKKKICLHYGRL